MEADFRIQETIFFKHHLQRTEHDAQRSLVFQIDHIGDTKTASGIEVCPEKHQVSTPSMLTASQLQKDAHDFVCHCFAAASHVLFLFVFRFIYKRVGQKDLKRECGCFYCHMLKMLRFVDGQ